MCIQQLTRQLILIKAITLIRRKPDLTVEAFQEYWLRRHVLAIKRLPGIRRYIQNHALAENYEQGTVAYDGIAELWGDDSRSFKSMAASNAYPLVQADEDRFIDRTSLALIFTSETVLQSPAPQAGGVKLMQLLLRRPGLSVEDFQSYWRMQHASLVLSLPGLAGYVQSPARPGGYNQDQKPLYDGLATLWFDSRVMFTQAMASEAYAAIMEDATNFLHPDGPTGLIFAEHIIVG